MLKIIHLSDLHFRLNWEEEQGIILKAFFSDLAKQIENYDKAKVYLVFSGDVVKVGSDVEQYSAFFNQFDLELNKLGITKDQRICIPGNHDVSAKFIEENFVEHDGVIKQNLSETDFNEYISRASNILLGKFDNYINFESKFSKYGLAKNITGIGWQIEENIGIYCLNTAICSSGGYNKIDDRERLAIDTRNLQNWLSDSKAKIKILVMHHPINWLTQWAHDEIKKIIHKNFSLCLSGHAHDQNYFHYLNEETSLIECWAPPIVTNKKGDLGYAIIPVSNRGVLEIQYRQWTKKESFRPGVNFSDTEDGKVKIKKGFYHEQDKIDDLLSKRLDDALRSYSSQPIIWVDPLLSKTNEITRNFDDNENDLVSVDSIISNPRSLIIKAPPQFGLTCLAYYLTKKAWETDSSFWLYLDSQDIKHANKIDKIIKKELSVFGLGIERIRCIILDSWTSLDKESFRLTKKLSESFKNIPLIIMQRIEDSQFLGRPNSELIERKFEILHLLALPRGQIRKVVSAYNDEKHIGEEDAVITKVVSDLEVLNIHRTPLNCLTLLKVSEKYFDESPVNRTKMLEMVLFVLFNMDGIPTYKARPDLKDCEYVLGRLCEKMLRKNSFIFSREEFLDEISGYCSEKLISLEVDLVFDILYSNNIIVSRGLQYGFRFTYWIYYFAAQRMHQDKDFASFILSEHRYANFPEIIEFYTGIDRNRSDALKILINDIKNISDIVNEKVGLPDDMNPYKTAKWNPSNEGIERMRKEIGDNVLASKLPNSLKDQYADYSYDRIRPYDQDIHYFLKEYSLVNLIQTVKACSRALRNSDYVQPEIKIEMFKEIIRGWDLLLKVLLALTPILAQEGYTKYEGVAFRLDGDFGDSLEKRVTNILNVIPTNVVELFRNDLFSHKMTPLIFDQIAKEENQIKKHALILLQIYERPHGWKTQIENYITSIAEDSFYLGDVVGSLRNQYRYSFATPRELNGISYLIKMGLIKHQLKIKKPPIDKIISTSNNVLPKRIVNDNDDSIKK